MNPEIFYTIYSPNASREVKRIVLRDMVHAFSVSVNLLWIISPLLRIMEIANWS